MSETLTTTKKPNVKLSREAMYLIIRSPVITEKATLLSEKNQYVLRVALDATKPQIKAAIELMFKTKVEGVTVSNVKGKERRFGRTIGRKKSWKKAYVRLAEGQEINFAATQ